MFRVITVCFAGLAIAALSHAAFAADSPGCRSLIASEAPAATWLECTTAIADQALEDVRILSADDMQGRQPATEGSAKARAYIIERLQKIGVKPFFAGYEQKFDFENDGKELEGANVVAVIPGTDSNAETIVLTAHYDHFGVVDGEIFNGADDNASGVAAVLALATALTAEAPQHTTILALVDAEEIGFYGSLALVDDPAFPLDNVAFNINLDMLSKNAKGELYAMGGHYNEAVRALFEELAAFAPVKLPQGHDDPAKDDVQEDWTSESDQYAFHEKGIPWLYLGVEDHPEYHKPTDDFATINVPFYRGAIATALAAFWMADERILLIRQAAEDAEDEDEA